MPGYSQEPLDVEGYSDAVERHMAELWDKIDELGTSQDREEDRLVLEKAFDWIRLLRMSGLDLEVVADDLYDRSRLSEPLLLQCGFFEEDRQLTVERIQRILSGISAALEKQLPMPLRKQGDPKLQIIWSTEGERSVGYWGANSDQPIDIFGTCHDAGVFFGELAPEVASLVADRLLRDLRAGLLTLPNFIKGDESSITQTLLQWIPPGVEIPSKETVDTFEELLPDLEELNLWETHPEMARVFDKLLCKTAINRFQSIVSLQK